MENLFKYATKELSQDAFLRWFLESYSDDNFKYIVLDFIRTFTINQKDERPVLELKKEDVIRIETIAQKNNIDIAIYIHIKGDNMPKVIVIEDKTTSNEHDQLDNYNTVMKNWSYGNKLIGESNIYKIFYKTAKLDGKEKDKVIGLGWTPFYINDIKFFFEKYSGKVKSEVLNDYINHVIGIYNDTESVSEKRPCEWNFYNFESFMHNLIDNEYKDIFKTICWTFRNIYKILCVYYYFKDIKNSTLTYTALEIQVRGNSLISYLHPGFTSEEQEEWNLAKIKNAEARKNGDMECQEFRNYIDKYGSNILKRKNTKRTCAKYNYSIDFEDYDVNKLKDALCVWLTEYKGLVKSYEQSIKKD